MASFTPRPLYSRGKSPRYPLDRRLGGPHNSWPYAAFFCILQIFTEKHMLNMRSGDQGGHTNWPSLVNPRTRRNVDSERLHSSLWHTVLSRTELSWSTWTLGNCILVVWRAIVDSVILWAAWSRYYITCCYQYVYAHHHRTSRFNGQLILLLLLERSRVRFWARWPIILTDIFYLISLSFNVNARMLAMVESFQVPSPSFTNIAQS
jgi:hypothetical protein